MDLGNKNPSQQISMASLSSSSIRHAQVRSARHQMLRQSLQPIPWKVIQIEPGKPPAITLKCDIRIDGILWCMRVFGKYRAESAGIRDTQSIIAYRLSRQAPIVFPPVGVWAQIWIVIK